MEVSGVSSGVLHYGYFRMDVALLLMTTVECGLPFL